jgi:hypothetical protein
VQTKKIMTKKVHSLIKSDVYDWGGHLDSCIWKVVHKENKILGKDDCCCFCCFFLKEKIHIKMMIFDVFFFFGFFFPKKMFWVEKKKVYTTHF